MKREKTDKANCRNPLLYVMILLSVLVVSIGTISYLTLVSAVENECDQCKAGNHNFCERGFRYSPMGDKMHEIICGCTRTICGRDSHKWSSWTNSSGTHSRRCTLCGYTSSHQASLSYTDNGDGTHQSHCAGGCGLTSRSSHSWSNGKCSACGATQPGSSTNPSDGPGDIYEHTHQYTDPCPKCGQDNLVCPTDGAIKSHDCQPKDEHVHSYTEYVQIPGDNNQHQRKCTCGETISEPHSWKQTNTVAATCTNPGIINYQCACGATKTESVAALGHDYRETSRTAATCTNGGTIYYTCSRDATHTKTEYLAATGHRTPSDYEMTDSEHYKICTVCGQEIPGTRGTHQFNSNNKCNVCGYTRTVAHVHNYTEYVEIPGDLTYHNRRCECGAVLKEAHAWKMADQTQQVRSCTEPRNVSYECTKCGARKTEIVPGPGHKTPTQYTMTETEHYKECTVCGVEIPGTFGRHTFVNNKCSVCGYIREVDRVELTESYIVSSSDKKIVIYENETYYSDPFPEFDKNGDELTYRIYESASNGTVRFEVTTCELKYKPDIDYVGSDSFKLQVTNGYETLTITFKVTVKESKDDEKVEKVYTHNYYIRGYEDGSVQPDGEITREEVAMIFYRLSGGEGKSVSSRLKYTDVEKDRWSYKAIMYLSQKGILNGYEDGTFRPEDPLTRAELATIISRYMLSTASNKHLTFTDLDNNYWAKDAIDEVVRKGWMIGYSDGTFLPDANITRAETATTVNRTLNRVADDDAVEDNVFTDLNRNYWAFDDIMEAATTHKYIETSNGEEWEL